MYKIHQLLLLVVFLAFLSNAQEETTASVEDNENTIYPNDEEDNQGDKKITTAPPSGSKKTSFTTQSVSSDSQPKPTREIIVKFINDLFQIPISLIKTVSNLLSAGLESLTSTANRSSSSRN